MKSILKHKVVLIVFFLITVLSLAAHFWNYKTLVNFHLDPPAHLMGARDMADSGKISLIGPNITSKEVMGREFFLGPFYYYVLAILGVLTHWNVLIISGFFTSLWLAAFILLFSWLYKKFGGLIAILVYTLLSFFPLFIPISRQIWNPHFIPLFGILFLLFLVERKKNIHYFLAGFFWGLGLNVHYATILWAPIAAFFVIDDIRLKRFHLRSWLILILGVTLAEFPLILFELRHNFYNLNTIIFQVRYGSLSSGYGFGFWWYYAIPLLPAAAFLAAFLLDKIRKSRFFNIIVALLAILSVYFFIGDFGLQGQRVIYPSGWTISRQKEAAQFIIQDKEKDFEVAETINSDTRALDMRWWLRMANVRVMDVTQYDKAPVLYLVTSSKRPPETETVWEVSSLRPFKIEFKKDLGANLFLYKLKRI
ncbi:hypothetical protein MUP46_02615 [Patescibacteria group bacterium]|nr:hypothetical protein [Patescibacteria group bacterium]